MDHIVLLEAESRELDWMQRGLKTMLARGLMDRRPPYGQVREGDTLYLVPDDEGVVKAKATVKKVINSRTLTPEESAELIASNQGALQLTADQVKRLVGKRYLVLVEVAGFEAVEPHPVDRSGHTDDWWPASS